jgi:hypothetical protein
MSNFAVSIIHKGVIIRLRLSGIFCAYVLQYIGVTPACNCNGSTALVVIDNGSVMPFFSLPQHFLSEMSITEKRGRFLKNSKKSDASAHDTCAHIVQFVRQIVIPEGTL